MKKQFYFAANEIKISQRKWPFIILMISGIILSITGILMVFDYIRTFYIIEKLFFGTGIIIFAAGLLYLFSSHQIIVSINSSRGIIEIKNLYLLKRVATAFPVIHFSKIAILEQVKVHKKNVVYTTYQVYLESNTFTSLLLFEFPSREQAIELARKLQELILLDIYYQEKIFKKSNSKIKASNVPDEIKLSGDTRIKKIQKESETVLKWKNYYNLLSFLLISAIIYGFYYITSFIFIHKDGFNLENTRAYIISGIASFVVVLVFLINYSKTKIIRLDQAAIKYYTKICGIKTGKIQMHWDDIHCIRNAINAPVLSVFSKEAYSISQEIMELSAGKNEILKQKELPDRVHSLESRQLKIDVNALPVSDRIRLEQEIHNFMV